MTLPVAARSRRNPAGPLDRFGAAARWSALLTCLVIAVAAGCSGSPSEQRPASDELAAEPGASAVFTEHQEQAGLRFVHQHGGRGRRLMIETMGAGGGFLDFDRDGWIDVLLVQSGPLPQGDETPRPGHRFFRNRGDGTYEDLTAAAGLEGAGRGYGMGACFADVDNDGWTDAVVTSFGGVELYRNEAGGRFSSPRSFPDERGRWATSCAFADYDRDGWVDLYVAHYLDYSIERDVRCGTPEVPAYCHPDVYRGDHDSLYRNRGDGTFEDVSVGAGLRAVDPDDSKGLGVVWSDVDGDGDPDLYVANDSTRNFLFRNVGDGTFEEIGAIAGVAVNELGMTEAGMGVAAGDYDRDGDFDLFVTHLNFETNTLYRNERDGTFLDRSAASGLGPPSAPWVGFGTGFLDFDADGDLDVLVANGHIIDNVALTNPSMSYAQPIGLYENLGDGTFVDLGARAGPAVTRPRVGRGAAFADVDNDGDVDVLVTQSNLPAILLRNEVGSANHWIAFRLESRFGGRDAIGARLELVAGDSTLVEEVRAGGSYLSQSDLRLVFGLGERERIDEVRITWPEGEDQVVPGEQLAIGRLHVLKQPPPGTATAASPTAQR